MANMNKLSKIGTKVAFAAAMAAALAMPANADEVEETPVQPEPTPAPVVADLAPVESSSSVQEVSSHNEAVAESNSESVQENNDTAADNEVVDSGNDVVADNNESIPSGNDQTDAGNEQVDSDNQQTDDANQEKIEGNEDLTTELPEAPEKPEAPEAPELPETPEVPEAPETPDLGDTDPEDYNEKVDDYNDQVDDYNEKVEDYNGQVGDYNEQTGGYNEKVEDYNEKVDDYNEKVEDYNEKVDEINKELQDQFEADHEQWEQDKTEHEKEQSDFAGDKQDHDERAKAYQEYLAAKEAFEIEYGKWETEHKAWEERKAAYEAEHGTEEEFNQLKAEYEAAYTAWETECNRLREEYEEKDRLYQKYLQDQKDYEAYEKELEEYEQKEERKEIYDDVVDYNDKVENDNASIEEANKNLGLGLNAGETMEEVAESNATLDAALAETEDGKALLNTLSKENRDALAAEEARLAGVAAALDEEAKKNYQLGSAEYAAYLESVKQFNEDIKAHNDNVAAYNNAVSKYNEEVDKFNAANKPVAGGSTTGDGTHKEEGKDIDWGNVEFDIYDGILTHMDVKYNAAASKSVDENGNYSENVTQYTVTGVYAEKGDKQNGLSYSNDGWQTSKEQTLQKDKDNDEFGNVLNNHLGETLDPVNGEIRFNVTLTDGNGNPYEITVNLDAESVYAEGSYYKPETDFWGNETDFLDRYVGKGGKKLQKVKIGDDYYYDISGESVFLISALVCDGMQEEQEWVGSGWHGSWQKTGDLDAHGLDLILNLQTMIEIYQADNAQKVIYNQGYLMGKTATATDPGDPGKAPDKVEKPEEVEKPILDLPKFTKQDPGDEYIPFGEEEKGPPTFNEKDPGDPGEFKGEDPGDFNDPEPELVQLKKLNTIEKLDTLGDLDPIDYLDNKLDYKMILVIPEVVPEEEPVWFGGDEEIEEENPWFVEVANNGLVQIIDEAVPLADAPNTGDASALLGLASLFSFAGLYLTGKKRRNESARQETL